MYEVVLDNPVLISIGLFSLWQSGWQPPAAFGSGIFFVLPGINHLHQRHSNRRENLAMLSRPFAPAVLLATRWGRQGGTRCPGDNPARLGRNRAIGARTQLLRGPAAPP